MHTLLTIIIRRCPIVRLYGDALDLLSGGLAPPTGQTTRLVSHLGMTLEQLDSNSQTSPGFCSQFWTIYGLMGRHPSVKGISNPLTQHRNARHDADLEPEVPITVVYFSKAQHPAGHPSSYWTWSKWLDSDHGPVGGRARPGCLSYFNCRKLALNTPTLRVWYQT